MVMQRDEWKLLEGQGPLALDQQEQPTECPPGVHSVFDPCPGDCTKPLPD